MFSKFVPTLSFPEVLSVFFLFHVITKQLLCHLRRPVLVFNYFFDVLLGQRSKPGSNAFASPLTASNTKRANVTWLPLEIMYRGHTWHDYPWPWVSLTWLLYNLQLDDVPGTDFENSLYSFGQSEKRYWVERMVISNKQLLDEVFVISVISHDVGLHDVIGGHQASIHREIYGASNFVSG